MFIGVIASLNSVLEKSKLGIGLGEEGKKEGKGEESRIRQEPQDLLVEFVGCDPYQGMYDHLVLG